MAKERARQRTWDEQRREVEGWRASGQSAEAYADVRGYSRSSLTSWAAKMRVLVKTKEPTLLRLEVERQYSDLVVEVGGARIVVRRGFDGALLRDVVGALGGDGR